MQIVGLKQNDGTVLVGALRSNGTEVVVFADVEDFWASPHTIIAAGPTGPRFQVEQVELVPPVVKSARVLCVGLNYLDHVHEGTYRDTQLPEIPTLFARWPTSLSVNGAEIPVPSNEEGLDWEGEVVAWIGSPLVDATVEEALAAVVGYSTFNDVTARRAQKATSQWIMGKNGDRSGPIGPMVPVAEVGDLRGSCTPAMSLKSRSSDLEFSPITSLTTHIVGSLLTRRASHPTHYRLEQIMSHRLEQIMSHRPAHLARLGDIDDVSTPVFTFSVLDVCGVRLAGRGNHR